MTLDQIYNSFSVGSEEFDRIWNHEDGWQDDE